MFQFAIRSRSQDCLGISNEKDQRRVRQVATFHIISDVNDDT